VARFLLGALRKRPGVEVLEQDTSDGLGLALWYQGVLGPLGPVELLPTHSRVRLRVRIWPILEA
jgi:hypothetical protein